MYCWTIKGLHILLHIYRFTLSGRYDRVICFQSSITALYAKTYAHRDFIMSSDEMNFYPGHF